MPLIVSEPDEPGVVGVVLVPPPSWRSDNLAVRRLTNIVRELLEALAIVCRPVGTGLDGDMMTGQQKNE